MPQKVFDDAAVREAMRSFLAAAAQLEEAAQVGGEPRDLVDLAEKKAMAGLLLRKSLERQGWRPPVRSEAESGAPGEVPEPA
jgi:hypothetical protein